MTTLTVNTLNSLTANEINKLTATQIKDIPLETIPKLTTFLSRIEAAQAKFFTTSQISKFTATQVQTNFNPLAFQGWNESQFRAVSQLVFTTGNFNTILTRFGTRTRYLTTAQVSGVSDGSWKNLSASAVSYISDSTWFTDSRINVMTSTQWDACTVVKDLLISQIQQISFAVLTKIKSGPNSFFAGLYENAKGLDPKQLTADQIHSLVYGAKYLSNASVISAYSVLKNAGRLSGDFISLLGRNIECIPTLVGFSITDLSKIGYYARFLTNAQLTSKQIPFKSLKPDCDFIKNLGSNFKYIEFSSLLGVNSSFLNNLDYLAAQVITKNQWNAIGKTAFLGASIEFHERIGKRDGISQIPTDYIADLSIEQFKNYYIDNFSILQFSSLSATLLQAMTRMQRGQMTADQLSSISTEKIAALMLTESGKYFISNIFDEQAVGFTVAQIQKLGAGIVLLSYSAISGLSEEVVKNIDLSLVSDSFLVSLGEHLSWITSGQMRTLSNDKFARLVQNNGVLNYLSNRATYYTPSQLELLPSEKINKLTGINFLNGSYATAARFFLIYLNDYSQLSKDYISGLTSNQFSLMGSGIAHVKDWSGVSSETLRGINAYLISNLHTISINALKDENIDIFLNRLNPDNVVQLTADQVSNISAKALAGLRGPAVANLDISKLSAKTILALDSGDAYSFWIHSNSTFEQLSTSAMNAVSRQQWEWINAFNRTFSERTLLTFFGYFDKYDIGSTSDEFLKKVNRAQLQKLDADSVNAFKASQFGVILNSTGLTVLEGMSDLQMEFLVKTSIAKFSNDLISRAGVRDQLLHISNLDFFTKTQLEITDGVSGTSLGAFLASALKTGLGEDRIYKTLNNSILSKLGLSIEDINPVKCRDLVDVNNIVRNELIAGHVYDSSFLAILGPTKFAELVKFLKNKPIRENGKSQEPSVLSKLFTAHSLEILNTEYFSKLSQEEFEFILDSFSSDSEPPRFSVSLLFEGGTDYLKLFNKELKNGFNALGSITPMGAESIAIEDIEYVVSNASNDSFKTFTPFMLSNFTESQIIAFFDAAIETGQSKEYLISLFSLNRFADEENEQSNLFDSDGKFQSVFDWRKNSRLELFSETEFDAALFGNISAIDASISSITNFKFRTPDSTSIIPNGGFVVSRDKNLSYEPKDVKAFNQAMSEYYKQFGDKVLQVYLPTNLTGGRLNAAEFCVLTRYSEIYNMSGMSVDLLLFLLGNIDWAGADIRNVSLHKYSQNDMPLRGEQYDLWANPSLYPEIREIFEGISGKQLNSLSPCLLPHVRGLLNPYQVSSLDDAHLAIFEDRIAYYSNPTEYIDDLGHPLYLLLNKRQAAIIENNVQWYSNNSALPAPRKIKANSIVHQDDVLAFISKYKIDLTTIPPSTIHDFKSEQLASLCSRFKDLNELQVEAIRFLYLIGAPNGSQTGIPSIALLDYFSGLQLSQLSGSVRYDIAGRLDKLGEFESESHWDFVSKRMVTTRTFKLNDTARHELSNASSKLIDFLQSLAEYSSQPLMSSLPLILKSIADSSPHLSESVNFDSLVLSNVFLRSLDGAGLSRLIEHGVKFTTAHIDSIGIHALQQLSAQEIIKLQAMGANVPQFVLGKFTDKDGYAHAGSYRVKFASNAREFKYQARDYSASNSLTPVTWTLGNLDSQDEQLKNALTLIYNEQFLSHKIRESDGLDGFQYSNIYYFNAFWGMNFFLHDFSDTIGVLNSAFRGPKSISDSSAASKWRAIQYMRGYGSVVVINNFVKMIEIAKAIDEGTTTLSDIEIAQFVGFIVGNIAFGARLAGAHVLGRLAEKTLTAEIAAVQAGLAELGPLEREFGLLPGELADYVKINSNSMSLAHGFEILDESGKRIHVYKNPDYFETYNANGTKIDPKEVITGEGTVVKGVRANELRTNLQKELSTTKTRIAAFALLTNAIGAAFSAASLAELEKMSDEEREAYIVNTAVNMGFVAVCGVWVASTLLPETKLKTILSSGVDIAAGALYLALIGYSLFQLAEHHETNTEAERMAVVNTAFNLAISVTQVISAVVSKLGPAGAVLSMLLLIAQTITNAATTDSAKEALSDYADELAGQGRDEEASVFELLYSMLYPKGNKGSKKEFSQGEYNKRVEDWFFHNGKLKNTAQNVIDQRTEYAIENPDTMALFKNMSDGTDSYRFIYSMMSLTSEFFSVSKNSEHAFSVDYLNIIGFDGKKLKAYASFDNWMVTVNDLIALFPNVNSSNKLVVFESLSSDAAYRQNAGFDLRGFKPDAQINIANVRGEYYVSELSNTKIFFDSTMSNQSLEGITVHGKDSSTKLLFNNKSYSSYDISRFRGMTIVGSPYAATNFYLAAKSDVNLPYDGSTLTTVSLLSEGSSFLSEVDNTVVVAVADGVSGKLFGRNSTLYLTSPKNGVDVNQSKFDSTGLFNVLNLSEFSHGANIDWTNDTILVSSEKIVANGFHDFIGTHFSDTYNLSGVKNFSLTTSPTVNSIYAVDSEGALNLMNTAAVFKNSTVFAQTNGDNALSFIGSTGQVILAGSNQVSVHSSKYFEFQVNPGISSLYFQSDSVSSTADILVNSQENGSLIVHVYDNDTQQADGELDSRCYSFGTTALNISFEKFGPDMGRLQIAESGQFGADLFDLTFKLSDIASLDDDFIRVIDPSSIELNKTDLNYKAGAIDIATIIDVYNTFGDNSPMSYTKIAEQILTNDRYRSA